MPTPPLYTGPLHLQTSLTECTDALLQAIRGSADHSVSTIRGLYCSCAQSGLQKSLEEAERSTDPERRRAASQQRQALQKHQQCRGSSVHLPALTPSLAAPGKPATADRRAACRIFSVMLNDEEGIVRGFCRRCQKAFPLFDRALYWGLRRESGEVPTTWPCRCRCGGHAFELGIGFDYDSDALDENDIHTITIAVRCAACDDISVIFDEEAS